MKGKRGHSVILVVNSESNLRCRFGLANAKWVQAEKWCILDLSRAPPYLLLIFISMISPHDLTKNSFSLLGSNTHSKRRNRVNGRMMRPYWDYLKSPRSRSASDQM